MILGFFASFWGWLQRNPVAQWIGAVILFLIGWTALKAHLKEAGRQAERAAIAKKQAEVRVAVVERKSEIIAEEIEHADNALDARNSDVHYPTYDSLPNVHKRLANGDKGGGSGG